MTSNDERITSPRVSSSRPLRASIVVSAAAVSLSACATVPRDAGYGAVAAETQALLGAAPAWPQTPEDEAEAQRTADGLLAQELTADSAMRVALVNSPRVRAAMEGLGIARADFLIAVRPPNPFLSFVGLDRNGQPGPIDLQFSAALPILDLILLPRRSRVGEAQFEVAKANAATTVIEVALKARAALTDYIATRQIADFFAQASDAARTGEAAAQAIYDAGNSAKVELDREKLFAAGTTADRLQAESAVAPARERVNALLGLTGDPAERWSSAIRLPPPAALAIELPTAQARAVEVSFALRSADAKLRAAAARSGITNVESVLQNLDVEFQYNRDDGVLKRGGGVGLTLPIFGLGHAERLRASSEVRQAYQERRAVEVEVRAQVRAVLERVEATRKLAIYRRQTVLPISNDVYMGTLLDTNAAQIGIFQLLQAKRDNLAAGRDAIEALRDYWNAWTDLQSLFAVSPAQPSQPAPTPSPSQPAPPGGR